MNFTRQSLYCLFFILAALTFFSNCNDSINKHPNDHKEYNSYKEIPGVTADEIAAIEEIKKQRDSLTYGMIPSTEAFLNANGEVKGYSALLCEWMTNLFGITFVPKHFTWMSLLSGLNNKEIDFTGDLTANDERRKTYFMTDAISQRSIKYFFIQNKPLLSEISKTRLPVYLLQEKNTVTDNVSAYASETFEPMYFSEYDEAYLLLKSGKADVLVTEGVQEAFFDTYGDISVSDFYPLKYSPVSLSTQNSKLTPFISVMQKALENGSIHCLNELYDQGYQEYLSHKMLFRLDEKEKEYIKKNPVIPFAAEYDNYPISFYNPRQNEWQGICFDTLKQIETLTGLRFSVINSSNTEFSKLFQMLEDGKAYMISELINTTDRTGRFLWPQNSFLSEWSVLLSKNDFPNINVNRVYSVKVGLTEGHAHTEFFLKWFPDHMNVTIYENHQLALQALIDNKVDMVLTAYSNLLYLTNYLELPEFKANIIFDNNFESTYGINKDHAALCSIIDKALELTDTKTISEQWRHKTYDYRLTLAKTQTPLLIGSIILSMVVLILLAILFIRSRLAGKELEGLVEKRTDELALQTATLTTLFDSIPDLIFTKNIDLNFLHCNKAFLEHFNRNIDDIIGKSDTEGLGLSDNAAAEFNDIDRKVINEKRTLTLEEHIPCYDGTNPYYETIKMPLMLDGKVVGIMGIARDITKRKETERIIASRYEYSKKLSGALAKITKSPTISAGILKDAADFIAQEGCTALNAHRIGIWKFIPETNVLESVSFFDTFTGENTIQENYDLSSRQEYLLLLKSERVIVMNNTEECKLVSTSSLDGYDHMCAALDSPIRVDGKLAGVVCVEQWRCKEYLEEREWVIEEQNFASSLADLMALALSGSERRNARDAAETASQTKSTFLANMSHEIRTPMNAILGVTELLIQHETLPAEIEEGLGKIYSSCELLLGIINDILDFSKIEAGKLDIMPTQYKIASLINDSVHLNMMRIESKPIEFELQIASDIPAKLVGDELRIKQILNNLLSNAFKYTDAGKVTLSVNTEPIPLISYLPDHSMRGQVRWLELDKEGVTLVLSVRDTGHGMTKDQLGKMFEEYSRFNIQKNNTVEGTGLGLAITKRLIYLMGGDIHVESEPNSGSLFVIRLPQETVDEEVLGKEVAENLRRFRMTYITQKKRRQFAREIMPYGSVLIVDDVETNLYVAVGLMKLYKLQIDTAMSGKAAIEKIKDGQKYDIIFMDHMMPEMDGIVATKHIRDLGYKEPIIALTANAVAGQADMFLQNGFDEFISKPIDIRQLNSVLNKLIRDKQSDEVLEAVRQTMYGKNAYQETADSSLQQQDLLLQESFIRDARKAIKWLEENFDSITNQDIINKEETLRNFTIVVHGIKSSLWNIGETALSNYALKLETGGREKDFKMITESAPMFLNDLRSLLEKMEASREEKKNSLPQKDDNAADLHKIFLDVEKMCADYDRKGILNILSGINNCSKDTRAVIDKIAEFVIHSDFEEAQNAAAEYAVSLSEHAASAANTHIPQQTGKRLLEKKIDGIDIAKSLEVYEGDGDTFLKILRSYVSSVRSMLKAIETYSSSETNGSGFGIKEEKLVDYKIRVHGIKGTSLDINAEQIGKKAALLENAAKSGNLSFINEETQPFLEIAWKLINDLESMISAIDKENPKPKKDKPDKEVLSKLLTSCKDYDMDGADAAMAQIEQFQYEADDGLVDWLRENIDRMNFKQIVEKLAALEK
ncbi:MAG: transporter substrate-binding domain-containing protein [Treponema sp.]|nr:transporter substrate-binding domain-containing protein [Treponema sp.]